MTMENRLRPTWPLSCSVWLAATTLLWLALTQSQADTVNGINAQEAARNLAAQQWNQAWLSRSIDQYVNSVAQAGQREAAAGYRSETMQAASDAAGPGPELSLQQRWTTYLESGRAAEHFERALKETAMLSVTVVAGGLPGAGVRAGLAAGERGVVRGAAKAAFPGIPESPFPLYSGATKGFNWSPNVKIAETHPLTGQISVNPTVWSQLTPAQQATVFYEELGHQSRILSSPMWQRQVDNALYQTSLGRMVEESMARYNAIPSLRSAIAYGWNYPGVNKASAFMQGLGVVGVPAGAGYAINNWLAE